MQLNKYRLVLVYSLLLVNILSTGTINGQGKAKGYELSSKTADSIKLIYGFDPLLYNGKIYSNVHNKNVIGNQYLVDDFSTGDITIKGIKFRNLNLNYDIYNQHLLLQFRDDNGAKKVLIVSKAWLENFTIDNRYFEKNDSFKLGYSLYQLIGEGSVRIRYLWKKELKISNISGDFQYFFSPPLKESYVCIDKLVVKYRNNRTFLLNFPPKKRELIKIFMKQNRINIKRATDQVVFDLVNYCNSI
jgi:hypothetical protein